jgi:hypothetical protein
MTVVAVAVTLAACGSGAKAKPSGSAGSSSTTAAVSPAAAGLFAPAPSADRVVSLVSSAGLQAETAERLNHHVHAHLDIYVNGQHKLVPAGIGIVTTDRRVRHAVIGGFDQYGGISVACDKPCISPLHTHDVTGTLHTESATEDDNTLGQFFEEWDVKLGDSCVGEFCLPATPIKIYVDGDQVGLPDAPGIDLGDGTEIAIVIGTPPAQIPVSPDFQGTA